ncbi:DUF2891 family protein [Microbacterium sp. GCS4]|uniref:DUF2891 family protein n=1 Tax=Microbacterium sp. GCS4 TaxID=1692239 RepID=UPI0006A52D5F|nr:DUF2891 family protein [Microbacterium sp. GCS4]KNY04025.1 hypothetical protein AKH00_16775 [Microbacterium sp. GCS4]
MDATTAARYATTCARALRTTYPYEAGHRSLSDADCDVTPERLHPAFHGSFDWHSSVHMQWSLVTLMGTHPDSAPEGAQQLLDDRLRPGAIRAEIAYLRRRKTWERPYGWAWALTLATQILASTTPAAAQWTPAARLLADAVVELAGEWLQSAPRVIRHGLHQNSAFSLALLHDAADAGGYTHLLSAIRDTASGWYSTDTDLDVRFEPSGSDIFSPALSEAALLARLLDTSAYREWFERLLPGFGRSPHPLLTPPVVEDTDDGSATHWSGLALSRAAQLDIIASRLDDERTERLRASASHHRAAAAGVINDGDFMSTHWLVSFALLADHASGLELRS